MDWVLIFMCGASFVTGFMVGFVVCLWVFAEAMYKELERAAKTGER